jgi:hypothetical protein
MTNGDISTPKKPKIPGLAMEGGYALGMKIYDNDWYLRFGLSYDDAAKLLRDWGVTFVIAQSRLMPMPDSAVKSEVPPELIERYAAYDDRKFRDALGRVGILYIPSCIMFFDPAALAADPSLAAIDAAGQRMERIDWYVGIPPTRRSHVAVKLRAIATAMRLLEPDGIHLGFMRWPGFWELWMPHHRREDFPEYSYDRETLQRFQAETGVLLPTLDPVAAASFINEKAREVWTDWKCRVVVEVIREVKETARRFRPGIQVVLNTLPFGRFDFDNAVEKVFGQRFELLADVVDVFEVMAYHQILNRPAEWIPRIGEEVKGRTGRTAVCTLQAAPLYLEGMHAKEKRARTLGAAEFGRATDLVANSSVDGMVFFIWTDFLRQLLDHGDSSRVDTIRRVAARRGASA